MADLVFPEETVAGVLNTTAMPKSYDLRLYRGDYVEMLITMKDSTSAIMNLTGYTAAAKIKSDYEDITPFSFTVTIVAPATNGKIRIYLPTSVSKTIPPGDYIWDFEVINPSGDARTYLAGDVVVYDEVT